jgi:hypothetical protein
MMPCPASQFLRERSYSLSKDRVLVPVADQGGLQQFCIR